MLLFLLRNRIFFSTLFKLCFKSLKEFGFFFFQLFIIVSLFRYIYVCMFFYFVIFTNEMPISEEYFVGVGLFLFFQFFFKGLVNFVDAFLSNLVANFWILVTNNFFYNFLAYAYIRFYLTLELGMLLFFFSALLLKVLFFLEVFFFSMRSINLLFFFIRFFNYFCSYVFLLNFFIKFFAFEEIKIFYI